jgi:hypothetical protein
MHTAVLAANKFVLMAGALGAGKFHLRLRTNIVLLRHGIFLWVPDLCQAKFGSPSRWKGWLSRCPSQPAAQDHH